MIYVGIDPGQKGGIAIAANDEPWRVHPMPLVGKLIDIGALVKILYTVGRPVLFTIERAQSMPKQGVVSTGNYLRDYGKLLGMCEAMGWPYLNPSPREWKNLVLRDTKKDKDAAINLVRTRYPELELRPGKMRTYHDGICDAVCLAEYGRMRGEK